MALIDAEDGDLAITCAVVARRRQPQLSEEELIQWMKDRMAHYKVSKSVIFLEELPKTGANKVDKKLLMEQFSKAIDNA